MGGRDCPANKWDIVITSFIGAGCILLVAGNAILLKNRNCGAIRARGVALTVLSSVGGLIWIVATIVVNNLFHRKGRLLRNCSLWTFWLQSCFGFSLWLNCLNVRMFQLHYVIVRKQSIPKKHKHLKLTILPLFVLLLPTIIVSILASYYKAVNLELIVFPHHAGPTSRTTPVSESICSDTKLVRDPPADCKVRDKVYTGILLTLLPAYFVILIGFAFALRNVMSHWNEFRQLRLGGLMSFFLFLLSLVTYDSKSYQRVAGRCFLASAVAGAVFYYFWARNWEVIYNVLRDKAKYEETFGLELNRFGERSGAIQSGPAAVEADPMERLVLTMMDEANHQRQKLETLVTEIASLEGQLHR